MKNYTRFVAILSFPLICFSPCMSFCETMPDGTGKGNDNWFGAASMVIREMEYEASYQDKCAIPGLPGAYHMANRAQDLRAYFLPDSLKIIRRTDPKPDWILDIKISGWDDPCSITIRKNTLVRKRSRMMEIFSNDKTGIHQEILMEKKYSPDSAVLLTLTPRGGLVPQISGNSVVFLKGEEPVLVYDQSQAVDKNENPLPLDWKIEDGAVSLFVNTSDAVFPVTAKMVIKTPFTVPSKILSIDQNFSCFGWSVGTAGDVNGNGYADVIVGAPYYDNGSVDEGAAFVYYGFPSGLELYPAWKVEANAAEAHMGWSVGTAGDVNGDGYWDVVVGVPDSDTILGALDVGSVYVYHGSSSGLGESAYWSRSGNEAGDRFGYSVACAGDVNGDGYSEIIVGAPFVFSGYENKGAAYVYSGSADGLSNGAPMWSSSPADMYSAKFGTSVASAGDVNADGYGDIIVGCPFYSCAHDQEGAAYVYLGSASGLALTASWTDESNEEYARFGWSVASAGDVNGDGYGDVIIGAPGHKSGLTWEQGRAFIYYGKSGGLNEFPDWENATYSYQIDAHFGASVACAGDVNGDGYADVIVGIPDDGVSETPKVGRAQIFLGSANGPSDFQDWSGSPSQPNPPYNSSYGYCVATAGDINGDGYSDVIIGAPYEPDLGGVQFVACGYAYVYYGDTGRLHDEPDWDNQTNQADSSMGVSVASAGDVDKDGFSDVVVGAPFYSPTADGKDFQKGMARAYYGSSGGLNTSAEWMDIGLSLSAHFGWCVSSAGDMDGDGFSDIVIGEPGAANGNGLAVFYFGSHNGLVSMNGGDFVYNHQDDAGDALGYSVACAGDFDNSGKSGVIIGSPMSRAKGSPGSMRGRINVIWNYKHGGGYSMWYYYGNQDNGLLGWSVATAGDVNGDGYAEILVGSPAYTEDHTGEGAVFLFHGNGAKGIPMLPRQMRVDETAPIAHRCKSDETDGFRISLMGKTPFGRGKVCMELEIKSLSQIFTGTALFHTGLWQDTGINGYTFNQWLTDSVEGQVYHWRGRIKYKPGNIYGMVNSRWATIPWNGWNEMDFRTDGSFSLIGDAWIIY
jgi:hypothetical protein